jgi:D-3-phosphoglycerate dehydrogenase / 2-oxoglutarate reductase
MKVLVADKFEQSGIDGLKDLGIEVVYEADLKDEALESRIKELEPNVLVVRSTKVTASMIEGSKLGLIIRAGAGYNTIDVDAASRNGVFVSNCPGKNSQAVAELAFGLIIAVDRRIPDNVNELRQGRWNKKGFSKAKGLHGRTLGLVGMGKISQEMIPRAKAFGMNVIAYSRWMTSDVAAALGIGRASSLTELAEQSDVISVHVSLTAGTKGMLEASFFEAMREGAYFVNTSRAEVVDQAALLKAMDEKSIFAGLDVFEGEPSGGEGSYDGPLKDHPRAYCTHHIGASTDQAQEAVAAETVRIVREFITSGSVPNVVNVQRADIASHVLVVRHADRVGVLAHVLGVLKDEGVNVQEMENIVLGGAHAAIAQISVDKEPSPAALTVIRRNANVFDVNAFSAAR